MTERATEFKTTNRQAERDVTLEVAREALQEAESALRAAAKTD